MTSVNLPIICLMGPTASGKTPLAIELVQHLPLEIISVDSVMIYKGMNIGTAKPDSELLKVAPHRLIDIADPAEIYSAGQFYRSAWQEIESIQKQGKVPLLVGGTMLYFRLMQQGLAGLPQADLALRSQLQIQAMQEGWPALHHWLAEVDPVSAAKIEQQDSQRIQRALEVYLLTGKPISIWQKEETATLNHRMVFIALMPEDRKLLHQRIALRFDQMLKIGLIEEARQLYDRGDLSNELPAMRAVGYRQLWSYFDGIDSYQIMREKAIIATRQLAKRQMTWLRSWQPLTTIPAETSNLLKSTISLIRPLISA